MDLSEFLDRWHHEHGCCDSTLDRVDFAAGLLQSIEFRIYPPGGRPNRDLLVRPHGVEDWAFLPCHNLYEGMPDLELLTEHELLTRSHLESLDCEGDRTEWPERIVMLRHAASFVVAESFDVQWVK
jgi:hypothetical protein